jgi:dienelactone hydrolase
MCRPIDVKLFALILALCILVFGAGWVVRDLYPSAGIPIRIKVVDRIKLRQKLSLMKGTIADVRLLHEQSKEAYTERLLRYRWRNLEQEAFMLVPRGVHGLLPAVLCLHGHHVSKEDVVGHDSLLSGMDYGATLAESGVCVLAPDLPFADDLQQEGHIALNLIMEGNNLMGLRVSYAEALLDYLLGLPSIDRQRVGCAGWSMGGAVAMYLGAVDTHIRATAISGYFGTFRGTIMRRRCTIDNYIPRILAFGDMADVACLIAPRFLWIENGDVDPEFPRASFVKGVQRLERCYQGHEARLSWRVFPGGHTFHGDGLAEWFKQALDVEGESG